MNRSRIFPLVLLMLFSLPAAAEEARYYDVEVIIFESLDENARITETWPSEVKLEVPPLAVELGQPFSGQLPRQFDSRHSFRLIATNQYQLAGEAKMLTESRKYRVLLHTAWRQPGLDVDTALPIHISQSYIYVEKDTSPLATTGQPNTPADSRSQTRATLEGYIKVILSRYLHMDVKLAYTTKIPAVTETVAPTVKPETSETIEATETTPLSPPKPTVYFLDETRKMRSKEVHYLDHPVLGVILLATPYEPAGRN